MMVLIKASALESDLLPDVRPVKGHTRGTILVLPHTAIRHRAIEEAPNQPIPLLMLKPVDRKEGNE
jgi:hypothetical protein